MFSVFIVSHVGNDLYWPERPVKILYLELKTNCYITVIEVSRVNSDSMFGKIGK